MAIYFNENESKMILLKDREYNTISTPNFATKGDINSLLAEIEFLNREIDLLKRKIKRKSRKW